MTTDELERIAASDAEMPDGLDMPEQLLFFTLRQLYSNFRNGAVNRDRAKREKSRIYVAYRGIRLEHEVSKQHTEIQERLKHHIGELYKCGCPNCKKLLNIFVGVDREDIPQDVKELHAWNERLRDLVKERSDRNAELATTIDKVRWALEKGDYERAKEVVENHV